MAEAGPGPSTMASSPILPGTARQLRVKRRTVNLVNPADPSEFSALSISPNGSMEREQKKENTPPSRAKMLIAEEMQHPLTPTGNKDGVKGILRPSGTPGSGNGVRFFPKNRFRVITPNQSINPVPPASPASNSFLSQLLAVTMPSMSPRKLPPTPQVDVSVDPDESWEVPGQEGEISLIASSTASGDRSLAVSEEGEIEEEEPWTGTPQVHSSPLGLAASLPDTSLDRSEGYQAVEMSSREIQLPADMSDLLTQKLSLPGGVDSFSVSDFSRVKQPAARSSLRNELSGITEDRSSSFENEKSTRSTVSAMNDSDPTIHRQLSPLPARATSPKAESLAAPAEPLTPPAKQFTSIFADMSAEQAGLAWPLSTPASPLLSEAGMDETAFHTVVLNDSPPDKSTQLASSSPLPLSSVSRTPGDATEYFDCASPSPSQSYPSLTSSGGSLLPRTPSPYTGNVDLIRPAKAMFEAHSAHTSALSAELQLYRNLAQRLQAEVGERDGILAKLNLRVIEGEMMRAKVDELESELKRAQREQSAKMTHRSSASPLTRVQEAPATPEHVGNRTTVAQAANRDLEIRLAKALADQEALTKELEELKSTQGKWSVEVNEVRATLRSVEEREREAAVSAQRSERELQQQLEVATRREQALSARLAETQMRAEEAEQLCKQAEEGLQKVGQLEKQVKELKEVKLADEEELARLSTELSGARTAGGRSEEDRSRIAELERIIEEEREIRRELESDITQERHEREDEHRAELDGLEQRLEEMAAMRDEFELEMQAERDARAEVEHELEETRQALEETKADLLARLNTPSAAPASDIAKLRAESASKDLEIVTLQRRKNELKEDVEMLNIALDSKQQELELMKRKFAVKGVAGATPLGTSRKLNVGATPMTGNIETPAPGRVGMATRRRSSAAFVTPSVVGGTGRMLKGGLDTDLWKSSTTQRTMRNVEEENRPPLAVLGSTRASARGGRVLA